MRFIKIKSFLFIASVITGSLFFTFAENRADHITLEVLTPDASIICFNCGEDVLTKAIREFEEEYPHITINHRQTGDYYDNKTKIEQMVSNEELPDIFVFNTGGFAESLLKEGKILALNNYVSSRTQKGILRGVLSHITADDMIYALPATGTVAIILCNKKIFAEHNLPYPHTFKELVDVCRKLNDKDIIPFAHGYNDYDKWANLFYYETLALRHGGYEAVIENGLKKNNFSDPAFLKAAQDIKTLVAAGAFPADAELLHYTEAIDLFSSGRAAMCYTGNWVLSMIDENNTLIQEEQVKAIRFPLVKNGKGTEKDTWCGLHSAFMVGGSSKHKKEAVSFAEFISEYIAMQNARLTSKVNTTIPLWNAAIEADENNIVFQINYLSRDSIKLFTAWDAYLGEESTDIYWNNLSALFSTDITPEGFYKTLPGN